MYGRAAWPRHRPAPVASDNPIFIPDGQPEGVERTTAELSSEEKQSQSHRVRAFEAFVPLLKTL